MRILIADDSKVPRLLLQKTLEDWGHEVVVACDGEEAWEALRGGSAPELAILDWIMPKMEGPEVCVKLRLQSDVPYTYIVLLTSKDPKNDLIQGLESGADDFLTKPFDPSELKARLRTGQRFLQLQAELLTAQETLRDQATHDPLTRIWNRRAILDFLTREIGRARREKGSVAVLMADVDFFKRVNDTYGHVTGDTVLREVAIRLEKGLRLYDAIGRFGEEEFLIVAAGCDRPGVLQLAERLRESICREPFLTPLGAIPITISFGLATSEPGAQCDPETLLRAADVALDQAKNAGRDRTTLAGESGIPLPERDPKRVSE